MGGMIKKIIVLICLISLFIIGCERKENEGFKFRVIKVTCDKDKCEYKIQSGGKNPSQDIIFYDKQGLFMAGENIKFVKENYQETCNCPVCNKIEEKSKEPPLSSTENFSNTMMEKH
jgi:hypothetical protein